MFLVAAGSSAVYPLILKIVKNQSEFQASWVVYIILITGVFLVSGFEPFYGLFIVGERPGVYSVILAAVCVSNITLYACLIPAAGIYGAAAASALTSLLFAGIVAVTVRKIFGISLLKFSAG
jgi:O-antigen/teichoic acid export membrane protein